MNLAGRSAIITGANQGLGRAIASSFVRSGASVLLVARGEELLRQVERELAPLVSQKNQVVCSMGGDVSEPASCQAIARRAVDVFPTVTVLVNNAGVYGPMGSLEQVD